MMGSLQKAKLSGAPDGNGPISITATNAGSAQVIHAAVAGTNADDWDEVWLVATNGSGSDRLLTLLFGGNLLGPVLIPAQTSYRVLDGHPLQNSIQVKAFADAAGISAKGYVNKARALS